jgi:hypothetical protein
MDDATGAIYVPPKNGLPFLVVTFSEGGILTQTAASRSEARVMLAKRTRRARPSDLKTEAVAGAAKQ